MSREGSAPEINPGWSIELEHLPNGNSCLDSKQRVQPDGKVIVGGTKLAGIGFQGCREGLVESEHDIGSRIADVCIGVVKWRQIQLHERGGGVQ